MLDHSKELSLDLLDLVCGGGVKEQTAELKAAILGNPHLRQMWDICMNDPMNEGDDWWVCTDILNRLWDICTGQDGYNNVYDYGDYSHDDVVKMLKNYRG